MSKIKLLIEVDEYIYELAKDRQDKFPQLLNIAVANGIPYNPSDDCISREALKKDFELGHELGDMIYVGRVLDIIDNAPTVEPICPYLSDNEVKQPCLNSPCEKPQGDLISREALKEDFKSRLADCNEWMEKAKDKETKIRASAVKTFIAEVIMTIDNAPTVVVDCKNCDGYEAGYSAGVRDTERPQGEWIMFKDVQNVIKPILKRFYGASDSDIEYIIQEIEQKAYLEGGAE